MTDQPRINFFEVPRQGAGLRKIAYADWGAPTAGRMVICCHGLTRNGRDFDETALAYANNQELGSGLVLPGPERAAPASSRRERTKCNRWLRKCQAETA